MLKDGKRAFPKPEFQKLHTFLEELYGNTPETAELAAGETLQALFDAVMQAFTNAAGKVFKKKSFSAKDLEMPEVKQLTAATYEAYGNALQSGITQEIPEAMTLALKKNLFVFSGMKTYMSLREAGSLDFTDENGQPKSRAQFMQDADKLNVKYNRNYLTTEYNFAKRSAQQVDNWNQITQDGDSYNLQYRTAEDDRVRESHAEMDNITLPPSDTFWDNYYPPNGWNCRCRAIKVRKEKYPVSNSGEAVEAGNRATTVIGKNGKNNAAMFRFNPGKDKLIFPTNHPYTSGNCGSLAAVWHTLNSWQRMQLAAEGDKCNAKKIVEHGADIQIRKEKDREIAQWAKENVSEDTSPRKAKNFKTGKIYIPRNAVKNIANHLTDPLEKDIAKHIFSIIPKAKYINSAPLDKSKPNFEAKKKRGVTGFNYYKFEWNGEEYRLNTESINDEFDKPYSINKIIKNKD